MFAVYKCKLPLMGSFFLLTFSKIKGVSILFES
jgi:hypothetical protein